MFFSNSNSDNTLLLLPTLIMAPSQNPAPEDCVWNRDNGIQTHQKRSRARKLCLAVVLATAASAVAYTLFTYVPAARLPWRQNSLSHPAAAAPLAATTTTSGTCGITPSDGTAADALARGCVYDIISGAWVPPACHDPALELDFLAHQPPWQWWADAERTRELSLADMKATGGVHGTGYFVTPEYHDYHCAYTWRKLHRALQAHRWIDSHIGQMSHTNHCSSTIYRDRREEPQVAQFDLIFGACVEL